MSKIPAIGSQPAVSKVVRKIASVNQPSGLPKELPLDNYQHEAEIINKLHPATEFYNAKQQIQNAINGFKK